MRHQDDKAKVLISMTLSLALNSHSKETPQVPSILIFDISDTVIQIESR
jgi:hypothetical protein